MNFKLLKIGLLCAALGLASCGGDSGTTAGTATGTTAATTAATTTAVANTGTVTVTTAPNNVVSIGASGTNFKTADATGKAVFTGLPAGAVDIHVFSADGYSASSYMGINTASITDTTVGRSSSSVVDVYVQVVNPDAGGQQYYLVTADNQYRGNPNPISGIVTFDLGDKPVGATVTGTVYAAQGAATSSAGNNVFGSAEVLNLGSQNLTTTATSGTAQANLVANFAATVPAAPTLVTLQSVTPPVGMTVNYARLGATDVSSAIFGSSLALPDTISSGMIGNDWSVSAGDANGNFWQYTGAPFAAGDTLSATATLNLPSMTAGQAGNTLTWSNNTTTQSVNLVDIHDVGYNFDWSVYTAANTSSVVLPTVPVGVTAPLTAGAAYLVDVNSFKEASGASYEQSITFFNAGGQPQGESIGLNGVAYTR